MAKNKTWNDVSLFALDVGSVARRKLGCAWARHGKAIRTPWPSGEGPIGQKLESFTIKILDELRAGQRVALGFECPLSIPVPEEPRELLKKRPFEGSRPWSGGAGPASMTAGMAEMAWILRAISRSRNTTTWTTDLEMFKAGSGQLLLWEAFVTGKMDDDQAARKAIEDFRKLLQDKKPLIPEYRPDHDFFSLAAAIALWSGLKPAGTKPQLAIRSLLHQQSEVATRPRR